MKSGKPRRRAVQLDLFSPVDETGNLLAGPDGAPRMHDMLLAQGVRAAAITAVPGVDMCGDRFLETGSPWA